MQQMINNFVFVILKYGLIAKKVPFEQTAVNRVLRTEMFSQEFYSLFIMLFPVNSLDIKPQGSHTILFA